MTIVSGRIKAWESQPGNSAINVVLESGKVLVVPQEKSFLVEKYPAGTAVEITHNAGTVKLMNPVGSSGSKPSGTTAPAAAKKVPVVKVPASVPAMTPDQVAAKEKADGEARMKENEEYARNLAAERTAAPPGPAPAKPTVPQTSPEPTHIAVPAKVLEPVKQTPDPAPKPEQKPAIEPVPERIPGAVSLKIHINLGSFCNFDLGVEGASGEHARLLLVQEAEKSIPLVANIMREAVKVSQEIRIG